MKKKMNAIIDVIMYAVLLVQMMYVFAGGTLHEILGILFFICLIVHIVMKRHWLKGMANRNGRKLMPGVKVFNAVTVLLGIFVIALMLSSLDVSRLIFPDVRLLGNADIHRYLATGVLALAVLHGGLKLRLRANRKKLFTIVLIFLVIVSAAAGLYGVPYMNRHFKTVKITSEQISGIKKVSGFNNNTQIIYFTRVGNTDFEENTDAVSGASLMIRDGRLAGNAELIADMIKEATGCNASAITLTGKKYPSAYSDTVSVAGDELSNDVRPEVKAIDISGYDRIILVYPLWWGTIPMPVASFLENCDFEGKRIDLVATQGSSGFGSSTDDIKKLCPGADVREGISIYCEDVPDAGKEIVNYLQKIR